MTRVRATFASLSNRNFRLFFVGQAVSASGTWMQKIGQAWLVLELTDSATLLGVTAALQQLPALAVGPFGGLLADRVAKRRLLLVTQSISGLLALTLAVLTQTGRVELWMVFVLALTLGSVDALDRPARQTFLSEMVGTSQLTNAVTLNSVVMNSARIVGPGIAGVLIASLGLAASFFVNAVSFLAVVAALLMMRAAELLPSRPVARGRGQLRDGLRYVRATPELLAPLMLMTVAGLFAYEFSVTIPLLARDVFGGGADLFGSLYAAMGAGAVIGGLVVAGSLRADMPTLLRIASVFSVLVLAVALAPTLPVALIALVFLGAGSIALKAVVNSLLQLRAAPEMRGRVLGLLGVAMQGTTPIGAPLVGWIAEVHGIRFAIGLGAIATAFATLVTTRSVRRYANRVEPNTDGDVPPLDTLRPTGGDRDESR